MTPKTTPGKRRAGAAFDTDNGFPSDGDVDAAQDFGSTSGEISDDFVVAERPQEEGEGDFERSPRKVRRGSKAMTSPTKRGRRAANMSEISDEDAGVFAVAAAITPTKLSSARKNRTPYQQHQQQKNWGAAAALTSPARRRLFSTEAQNPTTPAITLHAIDNSSVNSSITASAVSGGSGDLEAELTDALQRFYNLSAVPEEIREILRRHQRVKQAAHQSRDVVRKLYSDLEAKNEELRRRIEKAELERDEARMVTDLLDEELREMKELGLRLG